jgi:DNA-binding CsgD family transcriptional regulator
VTALRDEIVGREQELEALAQFFAAREALPAALTLDGEAGIGKTTLWQAAFAEAELAGFRILSCRPAGTEVRLSFSGLADLLNGVLDDVLPTLPTPQRRALEIALLRADEAGRSLDRRAVSAGVLGAMRALAGEGPLAIAVDDAQWLDTPSAEALGYAARRLRNERVAFVMSSRTGVSAAAPLGLERALGDRRVTRIEVGPLSLGALHRLIRERTGQSFTRPSLRRIHDTSGGNPFYALELARAADSTSPPAPGKPMPLSRSLDELLGNRLKALPPATREALFVAAAVSQPSVDFLDTALGVSTREVLDAAVEGGIVRLDDGEIGFTHPLMAAAAYARGSTDRRRWHARLAEISQDVEEQARHLALATDGPSEEVAALLMEAGRRARSRGAPAAAAELFESAITRTPPGDVAVWVRRIVDVAPTLVLVGERQKARALLETAVAASPAGPLRADALILLAELVADDPEGDRREHELLEQALLEAGADRHRRAEALLKLEMLERHGERLAAALEFAREALALAEQTDDEVLLAHALTRTADLEVLLGLGGDPVQRFARAIALDSRARIDPSLGPASMLAVCLIRAGRLEESRPLLVQQRQRAIDEGDESTRDRLCLFLAELEWLAGNWDAGLAYAREGLEVAEQAGARVLYGAISAPLALIEGARGEMEVAIARATNGVKLCEAIGERSYAIYNRQVLGFLELSREDAAAAHEYLSGYSIERGIEGTKRISFIGDEIESLAQLGQLAMAGELVNELERRGQLLRRPTLTAVAARCRALVEGASGASAMRETRLERAIETFAALGMPFERARTLLVLGEVRRRAKRKRAAREALEAARAAFDELGAPLWVEKARRELARIGGRTASGGLTPTERRVAELVADGRSNKEVAAALFVSVRAVEANLSRIYAKLGISSRTELARRLAGHASEPGIAPDSEAPLSS